MDPQSNAMDAAAVRLSRGFSGGFALWAGERKERMNRRGFIYVLAVGLTLLLVVASGSLLMRGVCETNLSERSYAQSTAFHLADASVDQAMSNLRTPNDASDDVNTRTLPEGTFTVTPPPCVAAQTCAQNQPLLVIAQGTSTKDAGLPRSIEATVQLTPQSVFQFAVFADQQLNVSGSARSDSYDSRLGDYNTNGNIGHDGDVGTNATNTGGVTVGGSIFVDGQVVVGPSVSNPVSVVTGYNASFITGGTSPPSDTQDVVSEPYAFPMPDVAVPAGLTCSNHTVNGHTTETLSETGGPLGNGTYCYNDLTILGGGTFTASGTVTVYLTGDLKVSGNTVVGVTTDPTLMAFKVSSTGGATLEGTITGSTQFYGSLYGPKADIDITGNAEVYGAIIAKTVTVSGSADLHYDKAMTERTDISNLYQSTLLSWRDL